MTLLEKNLEIKIDICLLATICLIRMFLTLISNRFSYKKILNVLSWRRSTFSRKFKRKAVLARRKWVSRTTSMSHIVSKHDCQHLDTCQGSIFLLSWTPFKESGTRLSYDNDDTKRDLSSKLLAQRPPRMAKKATNLIQYRTVSKIWIT